MKWCGQYAGVQPPRAAVTRENSSIETFLQVHLAVHADPLRETNELGAAREENMLPVIDFHSVDLKRRSAAADKAAALEELHVRAGVLEMKSCRQTGEPRADDRYALESHERTTTRNFSVLESAARSLNGRAGSRSIFFNSSS